MSRGAGRGGWQGEACAYHWKPVAVYIIYIFIVQSVAAVVPNERHVPSDPTFFHMHRRRHKVFRCTLNESD